MCHQLPDFVKTLGRSIYDTPGGLVSHPLEGTNPVLKREILLEETNNKRCRKRGGVRVELEGSSKKEKIMEKSLRTSPTTFYTEGTFDVYKELGKGRVSENARILIKI